MMLRGTVEVFDWERVEGGVWILGGRSIERDAAGAVIRERGWVNLRIDLSPDCP